MVASSLPPRVVIAGTHSGVGKTTVATGLMAAFTATGVRVGTAKVGPDYIDPGYHALASGSTPRNIDAWMCGLDWVPSMGARAGAGKDLLIVEGVMGLFDGAADGTPSSTAEVATALAAPVILVVDASSSSDSIAAVVHGFHTFRRGVSLAGVVLNRLGSDSHEQAVRAAVTAVGLPVLGALRRDDQLTWRDRHLGLVPVVERPGEVVESLARLGAAVAQRCDLDAIHAVARSAPRAAVSETRTESRTEPEPELPRGRRPRVAVAGGRAFSFTYADNLEALEAAGADIVGFDPLIDEHLPDCDALVAGGGFPEVYGTELARNTNLMREVATAIEGGLPTWAECGGLLWLSRRLDREPMVGALDATTTMTDRLELGYRQATFRRDTPLGPAGTTVRGHEFHYSRTDPPGDLLDLVGRTGETRGGHGGPRLLASYLHIHLGGRFDLAQAFVSTALPSPYPG